MCLRGYQGRKPSTLHTAWETRIEPGLLGLLRVQLRQEGPAPPTLPPSCPFSPLTPSCTTKGRHTCAGTVGPHWPAPSTGTANTTPALARSTVQYPRGGQTHRRVHSKEGLLGREQPDPVPGAGLESAQALSSQAEPSAEAQSLAPAAPSKGSQFPL